MKENQCITLRKSKENPSVFLAFSFGLWYNRESADPSSLRLRGRFICFISAGQKGVNTYEFERQNEY